LATAVGFIGLAGVTAEFGIVMLVYLKQSWEERIAAGRADEVTLVEAIREGAVMRVRPKAMTVATTVIGLAPILWETGTGSEIMSRIAAPMVGGMVTAPLISMFVVPAAWLLLRRREARRLAKEAGRPVSLSPQPGAAP
jgi:Cu(I)/Ag(I) efflux system membrane protein CusA/SilA